MQKGKTVTSYIRLDLFNTFQDNAVSVFTLLPTVDEVCEGYVFTGVCLSVHGGACVAGGGVCMAGGHAWRGMHGGGACVVMVGECVCHSPPPPGRYYGIPSMSRRYASYWNAFLFC